MRAADDCASGQRLLLVADCYVPATKSAARLIQDLAGALREMGIDVTVLAPDPEIDHKLRVDQSEGFTVLRVRSADIKGVWRWLRGWEEARLASRLWAASGDYLRRNPCRGVVYYSPSIFFAPLIERLKQLWQAKTYLILRDIFPQWAVDAGVLKPSPITWWLGQVARRHYQCADVIGVQTPGNLEHFRRHHPDLLARTEVLPNWMTPIEPSSTHSTDVERRRLSLVGKVILFYGGNIGIAQDMDNILRLATALRDMPEAHILLAGSGSEVERLRSAIAYLSLDNITILGALPQERYMDLLRDADIGLISLDRRLTTHNFPGKALGYMNFSLPILASVNPGNDFCSELEASGAALVSINGDDDAFHRHARVLVGDTALRERLGRAGQKLLKERFATRVIASQLCRRLSFQVTLPSATV